MDKPTFHKAIRRLMAKTKDQPNADTIVGKAIRNFKTKSPGKFEEFYRNYEATPTTAIQDNLFTKALRRAMGGKGIVEPPTPPTTPFSPPSNWATFGANQFKNNVVPNAIDPTATETKNVNTVEKMIRIWGSDKKPDTFLEWYKRLYGKKEKTPNENVILKALRRALAGRGIKETEILQSVVSPIPSKAASASKRISPKSAKSPDAYENEFGNVLQAPKTPSKSSKSSSSKKSAGASLPPLPKQAPPSLPKSLPPLPSSSSSKKSATSSNAMNLPPSKKPNWLKQQVEAHPLFKKAKANISGGSKSSRSRSPSAPTAKGAWV